MGDLALLHDVLTSVIFKEYIRLASMDCLTAGNVTMFLLVTIIAYPLMRFFNRREIGI